MKVHILLLKSILQRPRKTFQIAFYSFLVLIFLQTYTACGGGKSTPPPGLPPVPPPAGGVGPQAGTGTTPLCGNSIVEAPEACDDGNAIDGDGCNSQCQTELPPPPPGLPLTDAKIVKDNNNERFDFSARPLPQQLSIELTFSEAVEPSVIEQAFSLRPSADLSATPLTGEWKWNQENTIFTFTPAMLLAAATSYTVRLEESSLDTSFVTMTPGDVNGDGDIDILIGESMRAFTGGPSAAPNAGAVNVYRARDRVRIQQIVCETRDQYFGTSVSMLGDVNRDGYEDFVIGAPGTATVNGAAYVVFGSSQLPQRAADIARILTTGEAGSRFGATVQGLGDITNDSIPDIAVGAPSADKFNLPGRLPAILAADIGKVYIFSEANNMSSPLTVLEGAEASDTFGHAVWGLEDITGDGVRDFAIGAVGVDLTPSDINAGKVYIFRGAFLPPTLGAANATLSITGNMPEGYFGNAGASLGDINGDGHPEMIVGAMGLNGSTGAVYIFSPYGFSPGAAWNADLNSWGIIHGESSNDLFGISLAKLSDISGDNLPEILVGASGYNNGKGMAYIINGGVSGVQYASAASIRLERTSSTYDQWGSTVASLGDINGDNAPDIAIGSWLANNNTGFVSFCYGGGFLLSECSMLNGSSQGGRFGASLGAIKF